MHLNACRYEDDDLDVEGFGFDVRSMDSVIEQRDGLRGASRTSVRQEPDRLPGTTRNFKVRGNFPTLLR
jgi:hypothetical protein